jgi:hypothetical protein
VRDMCRSATRLATAHPGAFGHFNCDPSKEVGLRIALERMRSAQSSPAFILLGGDDLGHIPKDREGSAAALASQRAVAAALAEVFPRVPILPTVGNHDTWPYFSAGEGARRARSELAELYGAPLAGQQRRQLASLGYYVHRFSRRLWIVALETNSLALREDATNAKAQLRWLRGVLQDAASAEASVILLGHIAPGASHIDWDSMAAAGWSGGGFTAGSQEELYSILRQDARRSRPCVVALFCGHLHTGSVRLIRPTPSSSDEQDQASGFDMPVVHLSPSLTPRNPTPHMPAVRLYDLRAPTAHRGAVLLDAFDETLDLDASNAAGSPVWRSSSLRATLNLTDLGASAWRTWAEDLARDDDAFGRYMTPQRCADEVESDYGVCKASVLCAVLEAETSAYATCLRNMRARAIAPRGWVAAVKRQPP